MKLFYSQEIQEGNCTLSEEELRHAVKVLRLQKGDPIKITDGKGKIYEANITSITKSSCEFSITNTEEIQKASYSINIAIAPTKNIDRIEWFVEKATEIGVNEITFFQSQNSERKVINLDRVQKKAISAMKQSGQAWLPIINPMTTLDLVFRFDYPNKFIAHVDATNPKHLKEAELNSDYIVLIGPEGDFTKEEISQAHTHGFKKISLGRTTLRTETAGLAACYILNLINQ